jgi:hypothetical protein
MLGTSELEVVQWVKAKVSEACPELNPNRIDYSVETLSKILEPLNDPSISLGEVDEHFFLPSITSALGLYLALGSTHILKCQRI